MRVLYAVNPEPDMGASLVFRGLREVLGEGNVVDVPYKYSYHGTTDFLHNPTLQRFFSKFPTHSLTNAQCEGTTPFPWMSKNVECCFNSRARAVEEWEALAWDTVALNSLDSFDVLFVASRDVAIWIASEILERHPLPVVIVDCEDYEHVREDLIQRFSPVAYFKTALVPRSRFPDHECFDFEMYDPIRHPNVHGIFYASPVAGLEKFDVDDSWENKEFDVQVRMSITHECRRHLYSHMQEVQGRRVAMASLEQLSAVEAGFRSTILLLDYAGYIEELAKSKISISVGGHSLGRHPIRHLEVTAFCTMMLCQEPLIEYPYPFVGGEHCVFFDPYNKEDFLGKLEYYLSHDDECRAVAGAGRQHLLRYHTTRVRTVQMLQVVEEALNNTFGAVPQLPLHQLRHE